MLVNLILFNTLFLLSTLGNCFTLRGNIKTNVFLPNFINLPYSTKLILESEDNIYTTFINKKIEIRKTGNYNEEIHSEEIHNEEINEEIPFVFKNITDGNYILHVESINYSFLPLDIRVSTLKENDTGSIQVYGPVWIDRPINSPAERLAYPIELYANDCRICHMYINNKKFNFKRLIKMPMVWMVFIVALSTYLLPKMANKAEQVKRAALLESENVSIEQDKK